MPFTPKFVDLVRNVTTVQGTGPVALGAAAPGYTGLAEAVAPGEQFYYCIQGVDKPAEREVGRGTMQAGGTILREPIGGAATNFTSGTKTIALVAAAEWFTRIELGGQAESNAIAVASRTALAAEAVVSPDPAILTESGREGLFVFDPSDLSAKVTADTGQGIYLAPASAPSGVSGAWVRKHDGAVNVRWFGAVGDGVTNDGAAFLAAIAFLKAQATIGFGYSKGSAELFVPAGVYFLGTATLDLTHSFILRGEGAGGSAGGSTVLRWTSGTTGIRTQAVNTFGAEGFNGAWTDYSAGRVSIENIVLHGGYAGGAESEAHGIHLRVTAAIRNVGIYQFPGDGIFSRAAAGAAGPAEGNANSSLVDHVVVQGCRNGLYLDSADVNAWAINAFNGNANRQWGVWDSSFLGNTYTACHVAANGWDGAGGSIPTASTYLGNRYYVKRDQAAGASTNAPSGTTADNSWWGYVGAGGVYAGVVPWVSGTVFREGGGYRTDGLNAANVLTGCYSEGDQNVSQMEYPTLVLGGLHGGGITGNAGILNVGNEGLRVPSNLLVQRQLFVTGASDGTVMSLGRLGTGTGVDSTYNLNADNAANYMNFVSWFGGAPRIDASITSSRGNGLFVNGKDGIYLRHDGNAIASVTTGAFEVIWSGAKLGYGTGTGGAIIQATSKSTGVMLNKAAGQVTMNAASLAAATSVSFTLTNSVIAATDVVLVTIGSGATADAYVVTVTATAAGSCRIQVRNNSAGALAEALVLNFAVIKAVAA